MTTTETIYCAATTHVDIWHPQRCSKRGTLRHEGKLYCKQHHPAGLAAKRALKQRQHELEAAIISQHDRVERGDRELVQIVLAMDPEAPTVDTELWDARARLLAAREDEASLRRQLQGEGFQPSRYLADRLAR